MARIAAQGCRTHFSAFFQRDPFFRREGSVRIDDIIPYERNARNNEKAIPVVADSIREFGLRGQIVLESRENPVIVTGHTRVAACKSLGWTEIPDENIAYCDGLTPEQVKAYRLADNRTAEVATWNKTLLQHEVRDLKLDMSKFGFDFKSKNLAYGAERLKTDRAYNLDLVNISDCDGEMPALYPVDARPDDLMGFNYAKTATDDEKAGRGCHFFIDDYQFERVWTSPQRYLDFLRPYDCVLAPDFSLYLDMPLPMQRWNVYRSRALSLIWQREGMRVVPVLSWSTPESYEFCFEGIPEGGTVATSTVGVMRSKEAAEWWRKGMAEAMERVKPSRVLLYGKPIEFDHRGAEVVHYGARSFEKRA